MGFTSNGNGDPQSLQLPGGKRGKSCYLKRKLENAVARAGCTSGGAMPPPGPPKPGPAPSPPGPPSPPAPPRGSVMLFNVLEDPGEHTEVSAANPEIVARLGRVLDAMRTTAVEASDKLNCTGPSKRTVPQGSYVIPNCVLV